MKWVFSAQLRSTCCVGVAIDEDEAIDHGRPPVGKPDEDVGPQADGEPDEVGDAEVVADVLHLIIATVVEGQS